MGKECSKQREQGAQRTLKQEYARCVVGLAVARWPEWLEWNEWLPALGIREIMQGQIV